MLPEKAYYSVPTFDPDAYIIEVRGSSMHPAIRSGWHVLIEPNAPVNQGEYVLLRLHDGRTSVRELLWQKGGEVTALAVNSGARSTIPDLDVEYLQHVAAILPPSGRQIEN
jgi:phage repressor protein C with HTH and peptisase S24 domain